MIAVDSSVAVAGFASWHELHGPAHELLDDRPSIPAHAVLETYSVLTRLPAPHRAPGALVRDFLAEWFDGRQLILAGDRVVSLVPDLVAAQVSGGACYDALIGLTAVAAGAELVTADDRAAATYRRVGATAPSLR